MSAAARLDPADPDALRAATRALAKRLESRERERRGGTRQQVRVRVASRVGVAPGTLETLLRDRLKRLEGWVIARIARAAIADLEREARLNETELALARDCIRPLGPLEMGEVGSLLQAIDAARDALGVPGHRRRAALAAPPDRTPT